MEDRAKGLIIGGLIGDAFGSRYEFKTAEIVNNLLINDNYQLNGLLGGGPFKLVPGQVTDDSEMALALYHSIKSNNGIYSQELACREYLKWFNSHPFDIGNTTINAFKGASSLSEVIQNSREKNIGSMSNGCLMRIWTLMFFYHSRTDEEIVKAASEDCRITHPNLSCQHIVICYCLILKRLIKGFKLNDILQFAHNYAEQNKNILLTTCLMSCSQSSFEFNGKEYVLHYDNRDAGFIGKSFILALKALISDNINFSQGIYRTAAFGGDTDTNCCIAGAILGARFGEKQIHKPWLESLFNCKNPRIESYPYLNLNLL